MASKSPEFYSNAGINSEANPSAGGSFRELRLSEEMRRELADFLRTRREKIKPSDVGLPPTVRRRTPGLRREEVAELAGVGTTWYTWLEQARDIQASSDVLNRLGKAMNLTSAEIRHLFALAGKLPPMSDLVDPVPSPALMRLINTAIVSPAIVIGARWDVLAANEPARQLLPEISKLAESRGNYLRFLFDRNHPEKILEQDWEVSMKHFLAEFRSSISDIMGNPWVNELVNELLTDSPEFSKWWSDHDVHDNAPIIIEYDRRLRCERTFLDTMDGSRSKIVIFNAID